MSKVIFERKIQKASPEGGYRVALPSEIVEALDLKPGDPVKIFLENGKLAFGHRRLSIIDLSHRGRQPMHSEDNKIWLVVFDYYIP